MFRNFLKFASILISVFLIISGLHGLYAYFYSMEVMFDGGKDLFGVLSVPAPYSDFITWMSLKGIQSWFIPVVVTIAGILLIYWQNRWVWRR